jgi:hypothetical protein
MICCILLNRSIAAVGGNTSLHTGYCVAAGSADGCGGFILVEQNSMRMVCPSKMRPCTESANVSETSGLSWNCTAGLNGFVIVYSSVNSCQLSAICLQLKGTVNEDLLQFNNKSILPVKIGSCSLVHKRPECHVISFLDDRTYSCLNRRLGFGDFSRIYFNFKP